MTRDDMLKAAADAHTAWSLKHGDSVPYVAADANPHAEHTDLATWQADRSAPPDEDDELNAKLVALLAQQGTTPRS